MLAAKIGILNATVHSGHLLVLAGLGPDHLLGGGDDRW